MKKVDTWMPIYIGDYLADTSRLTTEQHGAYFLLLLDYWRNGAPPDNDEALAAVAKLPLAQWKRHRPMLVGMFTVLDGKWFHKRVEEEKQKARDNSSKRSASGVIGASKRWGKEAANG
jgi:uncharacterized protein YdaU (DUF1376 family)